MKRSLELIQKSWGENITQDITIAAVFTVLYALGVAAVVLSVLFMPGALLGVLVVAVLYFLVVALFHGTLAVVSDAVLYQYASGGKLPAQYTEIAKHAFAKKH